MIEALPFFLLAAAFFVAAVISARHKHNWTAWSDPVDQQTGYPVQTKRCKASACNIYKIRRVRP